MLGTFWLLVPGCGQPIGPTSGLVQFSDGTPVQSGSIELRRSSDQQRYASRITSAGVFRPVDANGRPGVPPGNYDIVVVQIVMTEDLAIEDHSHGNTVPRRYADYYTTDLKTTIAEGDTEPIRVTIEIDATHSEVRSQD